MAATTPLNSKRLARLKVTHELAWRLGCFLSILAIMMLLEWRNPAGRSPIKNSTRWLANFGLVIISSVIARLAVPVGLTAVALYNFDLLAT